MKRIIFSLIIFSLCFSFAYGQKTKRKWYKYSSIGFNINGMSYVGELDPSPGLFSPGVKFTRPNAGLCYIKKFSRRVSLRSNISYGSVQGNDYRNASYSQRDIYRKARNLSFKNDIWEIKGDLIVDLFKFWGKPEKRLDYVPYVFAGFAWFHHNPQARTPAAFGGKYIDLRPLALEGKKYSLNQIALPVGFGFRYKIDQRMDLAFELGLRFTFTDYLDDVSGSYAGAQSFQDDPLKIAMQDRSMEAIQQDPELAAWASQRLLTTGGKTSLAGYGGAGDQRGNPKRNDMYIVTGFHLNYILRPRVVCPMPKFRTSDF
jgi:hypothetical protein